MGIWTWRLGDRGQMEASLYILYTFKNLNHFVITPSLFTPAMALIQATNNVHVTYSNGQISHFYPLWHHRHVWHTLLASPPWSDFFFCSISPHSSDLTRQTAQSLLPTLPTLQLLNVCILCFGSLLFSTLSSQGSRPGFCALITICLLCDSPTHISGFQTHTFACQISPLWHQVAISNPTCSQQKSRCSPAPTPKPAPPRVFSMSCSDQKPGSWPWLLSSSTESQSNSKFCYYCVQYRRWIWSLTIFTAKASP